MQLPPPAVVVTWPKPNYVDPSTRGHGVLIANIVCVSLAFMVVLLRLYSRIQITCSAGVEDFFIVIGLIFSIAMITVTSLATEAWGWNRHVWDVPETWLSTNQKFTLVFQIMFAMSSCFTKISLLWFCRRVIGAGTGSFMVFHWAFTGTMIVVGLSSALFIFVSIFQCSPVNAYWEVSSTYPGKCMNDGAIVFSASVINTFTDFLVTVLPMPLIWRLDLPARQRLAGISIFGLGIIVNVAGSIRTVYVWKSEVVGYDSTWEGWPGLIAATVEINLGLICSSAPALRPLIVKFFSCLLDSARNSSSSYNQRSGTPKIWSLNGPSPKSHMPPTNNPRPDNYQSGRFEIRRTVDPESCIELPLAHHDEISNSNKISTDNHTISPGSFEMKQGGAFFAPTASDKDKSSSSLRQEDTCSVNNTIDPLSVI